MYDWYQRKTPEERRIWTAKRNKDTVSINDKKRRERFAAERLARKSKRRAIENASIELVDRLILLEMHDGICGICNEDVDPLKFEIDHVIPLSAGGDHTYINTQPTHKFCNQSKGVKF